MGMRPGWDAYFMAAAQWAATRSTCSRLHVGCVLVKDNRIISTGYNGAPAGHRHCNHPGDENVYGRCALSLHAERNAVSYSVVDPEGSTAYITHSPCLACLSLLNDVGVSRVVYGIKYGSLQYPENVYEYRQDS